MRDRLWIISSLDQAKSDVKVWKRIAETLCRIAYKIELKEKYKNKSLDSSSYVYYNTTASTTPIPRYDSYKNNSILFGNDPNNTGNSNTLNSTSSPMTTGLFSTRFSFSNLSINQQKQLQTSCPPSYPYPTSTELINRNSINNINSTGLFNVNNHVYGNTNIITPPQSLLASMQSLTSDFSSNLRISSIHSSISTLQQNDSHSSSNPSSTMLTEYPETENTQQNSRKKLVNEESMENDEIKDGCPSIKSVISLSKIAKENGFPMLLALQFEYIFSK